MKDIKPGVYTDITIDEYHENKTYLSSSRLKPGLKSLKHFYYNENNPRDNEKKVHFDFGNAVEQAILDPKGFDQDVKVFPDSVLVDKIKDAKSPRSTKRYRDFKNWFFERYQDKYIIMDKGEHSFEYIEHILSSVYQDYYIQALIKNMQYQYSLFWECPESGLMLKTRPDICSVNKKAIVDIKTTDDASPEKFKYTLKKFDYYFQAALQIEGCIRTGLFKEVDHYFWLVIEKSAPFNVVLYRLAPEYMTDLINDLRYFLRFVGDAKKKKVYYGYEARADNKFGYIDVAPIGYQIFKT